MLILVAILAVIQAAFAAYCYRAGPTPLSKLPTFLVGNFLFLMFGTACLFSPVIMINAVLLTAILIAAGTARVSSARFSAYAVACTAVSLVGMSLFAAREPMERIRMRSLYPFESLTTRLAYEKDRLGDHARHPPQVEPAGLTEFEQQLEEDEPRIPWRRNRQRALAQIHQDQFENFINSPGFGVVRMMPRSPVEDAEIPAVTSIRLPATDPVDLDGTATDPAERGAAAPDRVAAPAPQKLEGLHRHAAVDFVNQKGWGYVVNRDQVSGFQVHHFRKVPRLAGATNDRSRIDSGSETAAPGAEDSEEWIVSKVELVSLLKHDEPVAYVTDELPRMDKLADAPVRPLGSFERDAIRKLEAGEELVSRSNANRLEMVGAMRAGKKCLQCHTVDHGDLLGAFSYTLDRARPVRATDPPAPVF